MTVQITVRLPDEAVAFIDEQVESGRSRSRAAALASMIARERHRVRAEADIAILQKVGDYEFGDLGRPPRMDDLA
jgi:Arc/MetJ-type ribon-helix-helix transcriptional regulator